MTRIRDHEYSWGCLRQLRQLRQVISSDLYSPRNKTIPTVSNMNSFLRCSQLRDHSAPEEATYLFISMRVETKAGDKLRWIFKLSSNNWIFNFLLYYEDFIMSLYETDGTTSSFHISMSGLHISMLRPPWQHVQASISACSGLHINMFRRILNSGHAHVEIGMLIYRSWTCCQKLDTLIWNSILLYGT